MKLKVSSQYISQALNVLNSVELLELRIQHLKAMRDNRAVIEHERHVLDSITTAIHSLSSEYSVLLTRCFIEHETMESIADDLTDGDVRKLYRYRNDAVSAFAVLYFGSTCIDGIRP